MGDERWKASLDAWKTRAPDMPSVGGQRYGRGWDHQHPCWTCGAKIGCNGIYSRNWDGVPEAVCDVYHEQFRGQMECEDCEASRCAECGSCLRVEPHDAHCGIGNAADPRRI